MPIKSYIGNVISAFIYRLVLGKRFLDTQTGLRGLSRGFMKKCLSIKSNRFEFETEQLAIAVKDRNINIIEISTDTIYFNNNKATSFRPLVDSFRIYFVLFRYGLSSIITSLVDFAVFMIALFFGSNIFTANIVSRTIAILVQFSLLKKFVFHSTSADIKTFILLYIYVLVMGSVSAWIQVGLGEILSASVIISKVITEVFLFFLNFAFVRLFIFHKDLK